MFNALFALLLGFGMSQSYGHAAPTTPTNEAKQLKELQAVLEARVNDEDLRTDDAAPILEGGKVITQASEFPEGPAD